MEMASSNLDDCGSLPHSPLAYADTFPVASTDSTTDSGTSIITQVPGDFGSRSSPDPAQLPAQAAAVTSMAQQDFPAVAQVLEPGQFFFLPDGRIAVLPLALENHVPFYPASVPAQAAQPSSQPSMRELQQILQSQSFMQTDFGHQYQSQPQDLPAAFGYGQMGLVQPYPDFMQNQTETQPGGYIDASPSFDDDLIPLVQPQVSAGSRTDNGDANQNFSNLHQNTQRAPYPNGSCRGRWYRFRRNFHSSASNRGQRMQNFVARNYGDRQASSGNDRHAQSQPTSSVSNIDNKNPQNVAQVVSSQTPVTTHLEPGESSENHQQETLVHDNVVETQQQQVSDTSVPVVGSDAQRASEDALIQATVGLELEDAGTQGEYGADDITPQRPIVNSKVSTSAPAKLGHQTPMLRSRKGQSIAELKGSPVRQASQPLTMKPLRALQASPPTFYPQLKAPVVSTSSIPSTAPSVSEVQHQSEVDRSRATSVTTRDNEPHRAQGTTLSSDQLVTPNKAQVVENQLPQTSSLYAPVDASQASTYNMPASHIPPMEPIIFQPPEFISRHLSIIAPGGKKPSLEVACDPKNLPFIELTQRARPFNGNGVIRISNIPYNTSRSEIIAFLGRNATLIEDKLEPVHIIMDRISGKTLDAYIEFKNVQQAVKAVDRQIEGHQQGNKGGRLGNRFVTVEVCGLESLMCALFPKAKNVVWRGSVPQIIPVDSGDRYNTGFKGFINSEELVLLVKHVQDPNRIHFSEKCPQRPFECMISTIVKYPWYMSDYITIGDRDEIFGAALAIVNVLLQRMSEDDLYLNSRLLKRLTRAIFTCPGFTESQKDDLAFTCSINPYTMETPLAPMADHWYVFRAIGPKPGFENDVILYYIALLREATTSMDLVTLAQRSASSGSGIPCFFGNINIHYPPNVKSWTLSQVARIEWDAIDALLRKSLSRE